MFVARGWEIFFKRIERHLRIKTFCGMSENAVKSQIRIGVSVDLSVPIVKMEPGPDAEPSPDFTDFQFDTI